MSLIQPPATKFDTKLMSTLVVVGHPMLATASLHTQDGDVFITTLRFPIWPYLSTILEG
jgi:hypothetical protein